MRSGGRLDAILAEALGDFSRARIQRLIERGQVRLNDRPARKSDRAEPGDRVVVEIGEYVHAGLAPGVALPILFEDEHLAVIDKPAGIAVHGAPGDQAPSVAGWWLARLNERAADFDVERPGIVHRLDKDTSGVLLLAKTPAAQAALSSAFERRTAEKTYLAVVEGVPPRAQAVIEAPIDRDPRDRTRMAVTRRGRPSTTSYRLVVSDGQRSLLEVHPETGRTHQIRVHLAAIGVPVVNDELYGQAEPGTRQLLHAWRIAIPHPEGGLLHAAAPPPADLLAAIRSIGGEAVASRYEAAPPPTIERGEEA